MIRIRLIWISFVILFFIATALGDVRISHSYSTEGGDVDDGVYLHNIDYANSVSIYQDSLFAAANSVLNDKDEVALFGNQVVTRSEGKLFGTSIRAAANDKFNHHMSVASGNYVKDKTSISYGLESGIVDSDYFTDGGSASEDVVVDNVNYVNNANIYPQYLSCSGEANLLDGAGHLMDNILVDSEGGQFGTVLMANAKEQLALNKMFETGHIADAESDVSYSFELGTANASYFNQVAEINEFILTDSCMFQGSIENNAQELKSKGTGKMTEDDYGKFLHNIEMNYDGLQSNIDASLVTGDQAYGVRPDVPVKYVWESQVESDDSHSTSIVSTKGYNGNRDVDFEIKGRSEGLADKIVGPMHISPIGFIGISKELYMSYEVTR